MQKDLTQGSVPRSLVAFSVPFLLANLLQALYNVVDVIIVGHFGNPGGIGGVGIGTQVTLIVIQIANGFATGATVLIAQYFGAKKVRDQQETIGTFFTFCAVLSVILTVIMLLVQNPLLRLLGTPEESYAEASGFLRISLSGTIFAVGYCAVSAVLRGFGDARRPLYFVAAAVVINVLLDLLFVRQFHWSARGAALATVLAQAFSFFASIVYFRSKNIFDFRPKSFIMRKEKRSLLCKVGIPIAIQGSINTLSFLTITGLINSYGPRALDMTGATGKITGFAILPNLAFSAAISAMAGQNIGAKRLDRAQKTMFTGLVMAVVCASIIAGAVHTFPHAILSWFGLTAESIDLGVPYLRFAVLEYILTAVLFSVNGLIMGAGHTKVTMISGCIVALIVRVPFAYFFSSRLGLPGIALGTALASLVPLSISVVYFASGRWKRPVHGN